MAVPRGGGLLTVHGKRLHFEQPSPSIHSWSHCMQDSCDSIHGLVLNDLDACQPSLQDIVKDVTLPRLLPTAEQLSDRLCALRQFHPRKVCCCPSQRCIRDAMARAWARGPAALLLAQCLCFRFALLSTASDTGTVISCAAHPRGQHTQRH